MHLPLLLATCSATLLVMSTRKATHEDKPTVFLSENVDSDFWSSRAGESWIAYTDLSGADRVRLRVVARAARTQDGVAVDALMIYRDDGRALAVRDLRRVKFPMQQTLWNFLAASPGGEERRPVSPPRPGSPGHPIEHWRQVYKLWEQAQVEAPRSPIKWIREQYTPRKPDATVRRWVKRARQMHDGGGL